MVDDLTPIAGLVWVCDECGAEAQAYGGATGAACFEGGSCRGRPMRLVDRGVNAPLVPDRFDEVCKRCGARPGGDALYVAVDGGLLCRRCMTEEVDDDA